MLGKYQVDLLSKYDALYNWIFTSPLGGPRFLKFAWVINLQKGGSLILCVALMWHFDRLNSHTALTYTSLHGSYGLLWLLKDATFPDASFQMSIQLLGGIASWLAVLGPYWLSPYLLMSRGYEAPAWKCAAATFTYILGVSIMFGADCQKYFVLKAKEDVALEEKFTPKKKLITDGFFAYIRHPNYLGEMMLYGSFAWLSGQIEPWVHLLLVWTCMFLPNMLKKERSMSRYIAWEDYCKQAGFLLPKFF